VKGTPYKYYPIILHYIAVSSIIYRDTEIYKAFNNNSFTPYFNRVSYSIPCIVWLKAITSQYTGIILNGCIRVKNGYFLRMYLKIAHIWKMVKVKSPIAMNPSSAPFKSYEVKLNLFNISIRKPFNNNKAHIPKNRLRSFNCFCIISLFIPEFNKELKHMSQPNFIVNKRMKPNPIKARISHRNSVPFRYLNTMIIQPKYNSPSSDVVNSNVPPLHCDGSHPIGGFLLGE